MARQVFIHTFGCQMNESDSLRMLETLVNDGWASTDDAAKADLILLNTCAIREKAEQKLFSALGRYREAKPARGTLVGRGRLRRPAGEGAAAQARPLRRLRARPGQPGGAPRVRSQRAHLERRRGSQTDWMDSEAYVFPRADPEQSRAG